MRQVLRRGVVVFGLVLALAPVSAFADAAADNAGNQAAIDAAKAAKAWLDNMPVLDQGVVLGQQEIANAKAIARMMPMDGHAQAEIPNSMQQYTLFCASAIQHVAAKVANGTAMATARPWDAHAQAEMANALAMSHMLWDMIGETFPGNPYYVASGGGEDYVADDSGDDSYVADAPADDSAIADDLS